MVLYVYSHFSITVPQQYPFPIILSQVFFALKVHSHLFLIEKISEEGLYQVKNERGPLQEDSSGKGSMELVWREPTYIYLTMCVVKSGGLKCSIHQIMNKTLVASKENSELIEFSSIIFLSVDKKMSLHLIILFVQQYKTKKLCN